MELRKVIIGDCELYCGDCRDVLPLIEKADAVITDPPYEHHAHTKSRRLTGKKLGLTGKDRLVEVIPIDFDPIDEELRLVVAAEIARISSGWSLVFCQVEGVSRWQAAFQSGRYMRTAIWVKPDGAPQFTGDRPGMGYESIVCHWHGAGRSRWNGGGKHGVFVHSKSDDGYGHGGLRNEHPTKKPLRLMSELVSLFSNQGELVCDPFMGSGTTGVACAKMGRRFIGIERDERYFEAACRRIQDAYNQPDLMLQAGMRY